MQSLFHDKLSLARIVLAIVTLLLLVAHPLIPQRTLSLDVNNGLIPFLFGTPGHYGWLNDQSSWYCEYLPEHGYNTCGVALRLPERQDAYDSCQQNRSDEDGDGWGWENNAVCLVNGSAADLESKPEPINKNFSKYSHLKINLFYQGDASFLRIYIRNHVPALSEYANDQSEKNMSVLIQAKDFEKGPLTIELDEFSVDQWWVRDMKIPRALVAPQFDKVDAIGIDHVSKGRHQVRIESIELLGEYVSQSGLLLILCSFWFLFFTCEGIYRYYRMTLASNKSEVELTRLNVETRKLEEEKLKLATKSMTDGLTGFSNRNGLNPIIESLYRKDEPFVDFGLLIIDIDHFKRINTEYGHSTGDLIIKELASHIKSSTREEDFIARWGGEEFLILCAHETVEKLTQFAEKLRQLIERQDFCGAKNIRLTISVGLTTRKPGDSYESTFRRADIALYKAKRDRNKVVFEE